MTRSKFGPVQVDMTHHNYGRAQSPKTKFAGKLNWMRMQCLGAHGNLIIHPITSDPMFARLNAGYKRKLLETCVRISTLRQELKDLADEIAELNSPDKWAE